MITLLFLLQPALPKETLLVSFPQPGIRDLACQGLILMPPDGAASLLEDPGDNITVTRSGIFPLLSGQVPDFKETLHWIQFTFTGDRTGAYMAP